MGISSRPTFIGTAAEITALTGIEEGSLAYATDTNQAYRFDGSTWQTEADADTVNTTVTDHIADTADAHDASAISVADAGGYLAADTVEAALTELNAPLSYREDFLFTTVASANVFTSTSTGTTGNDIPYAIVANGLGGTAQVATGTDANAGAVISGPVALKASTMGPIWAEIRCKVVGTTTPLDGDFYFGLSDTKAPASDVSYVIGADGATSTGVQTVGAFIGYTSVTQTSGPIFEGPGADGSLFALTTVAGADTVTALTTPAVDKDSAYHVYRVQLTAAGAATFYVDGTLKATVAGVTASTALCPFINVISKGSHENTLTIDYFAFGYGIRNAV